MSDTFTFGSDAPDLHEGDIVSISVPIYRPAWWRLIALYKWWRGPREEIQYFRVREGIGSNFDVDSEDLS